MISAYNDKQMMERFKEQDASLYKKIDELLDPYRELTIKDEKTIKKLLNQQEIPKNLYQSYFVDQNLLPELRNPHILAVETLLKFAHLFGSVQVIPYDDIKAVANKIYYNEGKIGIANVDRGSL